MLSLTSCMAGLGRGEEGSMYPRRMRLTLVHASGVAGTRICVAAQLSSLFIHFPKPCPAGFVHSNVHQYL